MNSILGIIPARGGSKGLPGKNIAIVHGKPLIAWTIEEAKRSKFISKLIVSSDDQKIIDVATKYGADAPFVRPKELALDNTPGIDPIKHALAYYSNKGATYDYVVCLQCTAPLRTIDDIDGAISMCISRQASSVVSVCEVEHSPNWMVKVDADGKLSPYDQKGFQTARRQDAPKIYRLNGAIYMAKSELIMGNGSWYSNDTLAYIMDAERSVDIDSHMDMHLADLLLSKRQ